MKQNSTTPLITVITVVLNDCNNIRRTIESVIYQDYRNFEYIIIDGGSTDGTLDIINEYKNNITRIISEPDRGIYDAMNKGIRITSGLYLLFLNSGDFLTGKSIFSQVLYYLKDNNDLIYGDAIILDKNGNESSHRNKSFKRLNLLKKTICHQSIFFKKSLFNELGSFNTDFRIKADYEWLLRYYFKKKNTNVLHIPCFISKYKLGGFSSDSKLDKLEKKIIIKKYYSAPEIFLYLMLNIRSIIYI